MGGWRRNGRVKSRAFAEAWRTRQLQTPLSSFPIASEHPPSVLMMSSAFSRCGDLHHGSL